MSGWVVMRRTLLALVPAVSAVVLVAVPASATCVARPFDQMVREADAVWWGTVTGAAVRGPGGNNWTLTVRITQVLEGGEHAGETAKYFTGSCGPALSRQQGEQYAQQQVDQQLLFVGTYTSGGLSQMADGFRPGMSAPQQRRRALADLRTPNVSASPLAPFVSGGFSWWVAVVVIALLALVSFGVMRWRRPRQRS